MPRDMIAEPVIEIAVEPYRTLLAPAWDDTTFKSIEPKTPAGQRFAQAATLAEVLRLALDDFEAVSRDARYVIDFGNWHRPPDGMTASKTACSVCLAGAVIARSLGAPAHLYLEPEDYSEALELRLAALDHLRSGGISCAYVELFDGDCCAAAVTLNGKYEPLMFRYGRGVMLDRRRRQRFLAIMRTMQADLARAGL
jgi:hypothetical protein